MYLASTLADLSTFSHVEIDTLQPLKTVNKNP